MFRLKVYSHHLKKGYFSYKNTSEVALQGSFVYVEPVLFCSYSSVKVWAVSVISLDEEMAQMFYYVMNRGVLAVTTTL